MLSRPYLELLRQARRVTRKSDEAEDLLQTVLLAAVEAGRQDLACPENRRWMQGALRKRAAFDARTAIRRRKREDCWLDGASGSSEPSALPMSFLATLSPALRTTALLVLTGHTKPEIIWMQRLSEAAFRQRICEIRRRWRLSGTGRIDDMPGLSGYLSYGTIRRTLLGPVHRHQAALGSHDPDGHLFIMNFASQNNGPRQQGIVQPQQRDEKCSENPSSAPSATTSRT